MKKALPAACLAAMLMTGSYAPRVMAQGAGVVGYWQEPGGSVLHIAPCNGSVCATLARVSTSAPHATDTNNPDAKLRGRPLCGLVIGTGFKLQGTAEAEDGRLYDPKSGKTYRGTMRSEGNVLHLRGYVGFKAFGRSEDWTRTAPVEACGKPSGE